jgi:hypothetical protein
MGGLKEDICEVNETGSGPFNMAVFGTSCVELPVSAIPVLVCVIYLNFIPVNLTRNSN